MPLAEELRKNLEGETADLVNAKLGAPAGGMLVGGLFLQEFVGERPAKKGEESSQIDWAHLDIAGPANNDAAPYGFIGKGASGSYVRTLVTLAEHAAKTQAGLNPDPFLLRKTGVGFYNASPLDLPRLLGDQDHIRQNLYAYLQAFSASARSA